MPFRRHRRAGARASRRASPWNSETVRPALGDLVRAPRVERAAAGSLHAHPRVPLPHAHRRFRAAGAICSFNRCRRQVRNALSIPLSRICDSELIVWIHFFLFCLTSCGILPHDTRAKTLPNLTRIGAEGGSRHSHDQMVLRQAAAEPLPHEQGRRLSLTPPCSDADARGRCAGAGAAARAAALSGGVERTAVELADGDAHRRKRREPRPPARRL